MATAVNERVGPAQGFQRAMVGVGHLTPKPSMRAQGGLEVAKWDRCSWFGLRPAVVAKKMSEAGVWWRCLVFGQWGPYEMG